MIGTECFGGWEIWLSFTGDSKVMETGDCFTGAGGVTGGVTVVVCCVHTVVEGVEEN